MDQNSARATIVARFREAEHDPGDIFKMTKTRRTRRRGQYSSAVVPYLSTCVQNHDLAGTSPT